MATKAAPRSGQNKQRSSSGSGARPKAGGAKTQQRASGGASRSKSATARKPSPARSGSTGRGTPRENGSGDEGAIASLKDAVTKAGGPAAAVGAVAMAVVGGLVLKGRPRQKTVLGVRVPRSIGTPNLSDIDLKSVAKSVGKASAQFGQTTKSVSKDIERVGEQAERIGKLLS
jgi:hypothetical protein